jgi:hypothetical protein
MAFVKTAVTIQIDSGQVQQILTGRDGPVFQAVQRAGRQTATYAVLELTGAGIGNTGKLNQSIESRTEVRGDQVVSRVGSELPYARFVHEGTSSPIVPTTRRVLRFRGSGGAFVFAPQVRGTKETGNYVPFLTNALERLNLQDFT